MNRLKRHQKYHDLVNKCELLMQEAPLMDLPIKHYFTDGMYARELFIPAGVWLTSQIHLTQHPYIVSMGEINILTEKGTLKIVAPYTGINEAGTRRLGFAVTDTIWTALFPNPDNCRDLAILEERLFKKYENPLLTLNTHAA